jgi:hypothetical protein
VEDNEINTDNHGVTLGEKVMGSSGRHHVTSSVRKVVARGLRAVRNEYWHRNDPAEPYRVMVG